MTTQKSIRRQFFKQGKGFPFIWRNRWARFSAKGGSNEEFITHIKTNFGFGCVGGDTWFDEREDFRQVNRWSNGEAFVEIDEEGEISIWVTKR